VPPPPFDQDGVGDETPQPVAPLRPLAGIHRRRRIVAAALLAAGAVLVVILAVSGGGHGRARRAPTVPYTPIVAPPTFLQAQADLEADTVNRTLAYTPYITRGTPRHREVALTFDDGPGPYTPEIVAILRAHRTAATFFVVGQSLRYFSSYLTLELRPGFVIGDHTENHAFLSLLSTRDQSAQLLQQAAAIRALGAPFPHLFRPPYGSFNAATLALLHRYGMLMVLWSVDTDDYRQPGVKTIVDRALAGAVPGAIILLHDAGGRREQTVAALPRIIAGLRRRHLTPVTVPQLLHDDPPPAGQPAPHPLSGGAG
jgi:peptidoglycan/xylan/chitin deacetylase (PgdA/CDA1 family)